jgi:hypothetical protein
VPDNEFSDVVGRDYSTIIPSSWHSPPARRPRYPARALSRRPIARLFQWHRARHRTQRSLLLDALALLLSEVSAANFSRRCRRIHQVLWLGQSLLSAQRRKGKGHAVALRALAFKWIRIIWKCWQTHTPYDEARYLAQLRQTNSPLGAVFKSRSRGEQNLPRPRLPHAIE